MNIVGFLLGKRIMVEVSQMEFSGLELVYGGVTIAHRGCGRRRLKGMRGTMPIWLESDAVAVAVLVFGILAVELVALTI